MCIRDRSLHILLEAVAVCNQQVMNNHPLHTGHLAEFLARLARHLPLEQIVQHAELAADRLLLHQLLASLLLAY